MFSALLRKETKIQKKGGEREMKIVYKIGAMLILITALTLFSMPTQASADVSLKNVWMTVKTIITSSIDGLGRLIGQGQTVNSIGVDLQGNNFNSISTIDFEIKLGKAVISQRTTTTETSHEDGSWSKTTQKIWYKSDANGVIEGAWGKDTNIEGREKDYYTPKDKFIALGGNIDSPNVVDKNPVDKDLDGDGKIVDSEKDLIRVRGNTYSGSADLQFIIIDGEAYVSHREQNLTFYSSITGQKQSDRKVVSDYTYAIKGGKVVMTDERSTTTDTSPQVFTYTDENGGVHQTDTHLFQARYIHTKNEYDTNGNLLKASGKGYGWGLVETQIGFSVYTSDIEVTYAITNGQAIQTKYEETAYYAPAQNAPEPIAPPPAPADDPKGTIIDMFNIHSSHVLAGNTNVGEYNEYTWLVVRVDLDDNGNAEAPDGNPDNDKVYLVRVLTKAGASNWDKTTFDISSYKVGDTVTFLGDNGNGTLVTRDINGAIKPHRILRLTKIE